MLTGSAASSKLMMDFQGKTVHRRTVSVRGYMSDLHVRVRESLLDSSSFGGDGYLSSLGQELGSMPDAVFDALVQLFVEHLALNVDGELDLSTVLCAFPDDFPLYARLTDTALYRSLRYMMCKFIVISWFETEFLIYNSSFRLQDFSWYRDGLCRTSIIEGPSENFHLFEFSVDCVCWEPLHRLSGWPRAITQTIIRWFDVSTLISRFSWI